MRFQAWLQLLGIDDIRAADVPNIPNITSNAFVRVGLKSWVELCGQWISLNCDSLQRILAQSQVVLVVNELSVSQ